MWLGTMMSIFAALGCYEQNHPWAALAFAILALVCYLIDNWESGEICEVEALPLRIVDGMQEIIEEIRERLEEDDRGATKQELARWERRISNVFGDELE
jgi:hypothetical protein